MELEHERSEGSLPYKDGTGRDGDGGSGAIGTRSE